MPPGTAPPERSFGTVPNADIISPETTGEHAGKGEEAVVSAKDTLVGATSKDVHKGLGHPGSGQPASQRKFHKDRSGLEGRGANKVDWVKERGLDRDHRKGGKLTSIEGRAEILSAEDRLPGREVELSSERP